MTPLVRPALRTRAFACAFALATLAATVTARHALAATTRPVFVPRTLGAGTTVLYRRRVIADGSKTVTIFVGPQTFSGGQQITTGPDGALWFVLGGPNNIVRFTPSGIATLFTPPTSGSNPSGIATASDGKHLFFSENSAQKIGEVNASGTFNEFSIGTPSVNPGEMTLGPDKRVWYATSSAAVGAVSAKGKSTVYPLPSGESPNTIASGPDGALWYSQNFPQTLGHVTVKGVAKSFPIGTGTNGITGGVNNEMWFCDANNPRIGRISTNGQNLTFFTQGITTTPQQIVMGPNGDFYFTEFDGTRGFVAQITPTGKVTETPVPYGFAPHGITVGPDKNIWVLDTQHDQIGMLVIQ